MCTMFIQSKCSGFWGRMPVPPSASTLALGEAAQFLWQEWQGRKDLKAKQTLWVSGQPVLLIAKSSSERLIGLIAGPQFLASAWMGEFEPVGERYGRVWLLRIMRAEASSGR